MKNILRQNPLGEVRGIEVRPGYRTQGVPIARRIPFVVPARGFRIRHHSFPRWVRHGIVLVHSCCSAFTKNVNFCYQVEPKEPRATSCFSAAPLETLPTRTAAICEPMGNLRISISC